MDGHKGYYAAWKTLGRPENSVTSVTNELIRTYISTYFFGTSKIYYLFKYQIHFQQRELK